MFSWNPTVAGLNTALNIERADGVYLYDMNGKRYLDWNSQAMCTNLGHTQPRVVEAVTAQMNKISHAWADKTITPVKAQVSALLADILPGDLNTMFYTCGGAEANETALRLARRMTGRGKILARYRSYHGGSSGTLNCTGDPRNWFAEPIPGIVKVMDPWPYTFSWADGAPPGEEEATITRRNLEYLEEVIQYEGPNNIAAFILECVTGTNGVLPPPAGYLAGVRELCTKYGIMMIADEVMSGFGRTGEMFGFMHGGIVPDMTTMAKGINGAFLPLGAVAVNDSIAEFFKTNAPGIGTTYNSHPEMAAFHSALVDGGLFAVSRWSSLYCNPPLIINEEQICEGFAVIEKALPILDEAMED